MMSEEGAYDLVIASAEGRVTKDRIAPELREHSRGE